MTSQDSSPPASLLPRDRIAAAVQARLDGRSPPGSGVGTDNDAEASSSSSSSSAAVSLAELSKRKREEEELLLKLRRVVDLQIRRDNNYANAAECLRTLDTLLDNILKNPAEAKYRSFKTQNARIQRTVLSINGGQAYLLLAGFGARTVDFKQEWFLSTAVQPLPSSNSTTKQQLPDFRWRKVELAHKVLKERLSESEERANREVQRKKREEEVESNRARRALDEAREDRERVALRAERDRFARRAKEEQDQRDSARSQDEDPTAGVYGQPHSPNPASPTISRDDYTRDVPFDDPSTRADAADADINSDGEVPPPYGRDHLGSGRRLGD